MQSIEEFSRLSTPNHLNEWRCRLLDPLLAHSLGGGMRSHQCNLIHLLILDSVNLPVLLTHFIFSIVSPPNNRIVICDFLAPLNGIM